MLKLILDFFFPKYCIVCETKWEYLCKSCKKNIIPHPEICPVCHKFSEDYMVCRDCIWLTKISGIIIPFSYTTSVKKLILKLKYYHKKDLWDFIVERLNLALLCNGAFQRSIKKGNVACSFIPSHWRRHYFIKGYNQSEVLARKLSKITNYQMLTVAKKTKHTKSQAKLSKLQRKKNLKNVFSIDLDILSWYKTLLLVDDVTTTGSTLIELTKQIKKTYPNLDVWWIVIARHI